MSPYGIPPTVPPKHTIAKDRDRDPQILRKKPPIVPNPTAAVGILKALDPHPELHPLQRENSDEYSNEQSSREEKREKKSFWERTKEREREKEKERERKQEKERREEEGQAELTRMIGPWSTSQHTTNHIDVSIYLLLSRLSDSHRIRGLVVGARGLRTGVPERGSCQRSDEGAETGIQVRVH